MRETIDEGVTVVWLDAYERRARLIPGMLVLAPVAVVIVMFGLRSDPVVTATLGAVTAFGAPAILATQAGHRGRAVQPRLYAEWGGTPTTTLLKGTTARATQWRDAAAKLSALQLPQLGADDPNDTYDAAVAIIISRTRDRKQFPMVFSENCNYGYQRNLCGVRVEGRLISTACLIGSTGAVGAAVYKGDNIREEWIIGLIVLAVLTVAWFLLPSKARVREAAEKYARQLLDAGVTLAAPGGGDSPGYDSTADR
jgi:hypothetical protein